MTIWKTIIIIISVLVIIQAIAYTVIRTNPNFGGQIKGVRKIAVEKSPNYRDGKFVNIDKTDMKFPFIDVMKAYREKGIEREPLKALPNIKIEKEHYSPTSDSVTTVTWLGHSSVIIQIAGKTILTDPVFSKRASVFSSVGPKAFQYQFPIEAAQMPNLDAIIISHDHYDHLDYKTILALSAQTKVFITALGVGAHLERWGIAPSRIIELDWHQQYALSEVVSITATPMRHFSGRGPTNRFSTLWASWVIASPNKNLFFSADGGYSTVFKQIGEKYGPFDLAMIECGAYSKFWAQIHLMPEESVQANIDLNSKAMLPIHWAKFSLSVHAWREPIERVTAEAKLKNIAITTPMIGEKVNLANAFPTHAWWKAL